MPRSEMVPRSRSRVLLLQQWVTERMNGASDSGVKTRHWSEEVSARLPVLPQDRIHNCRPPSINPETPPPLASSCERSKDGEGKEETEREVTIPPVDVGGRS